MDSIGSLFKEKLSLSEEQVSQIDAIFKSYMREYTFGDLDAQKLGVLKYNHLRQALEVLSNEQRLNFLNQRKQAKAKKKSNQQRSLIRRKKSIAANYGELNLTDVQIEAFIKANDEAKDFVSKRMRERAKDRSLNIDLQSEKKAFLINAIKNTLNETQLKQYDDIQSQHNQRQQEQEIYATKATYHHLNINDEQAQLIMGYEKHTHKSQSLQRMSVWERWEEESKFMVDILNPNQFIQYEKRITEKKIDKRKRIAERDKKVAPELVKLHNNRQYLIEEILPIKCAITASVMQDCSDFDLEKIAHIRKLYIQSIHESITKLKSNHTKHNLDLAPLALEENIKRQLNYFINPSAMMIKDSIDLNENIFESLELNQAHMQSVNNLEKKIKDRFILEFESRKNPYGGWLTVIKNDTTYKYLDLYSLLLLHPDIEKNIELMNKVP